MNAKDQKVGRWIVGVLVIIVLIQWYLGASKTAKIEQDYKTRLDELQGQTAMIMDKYEVEKTEQCRTATMNVMSFKEKVKDLEAELQKKSDFKDGLCNGLKNTPNDVKNPYEYYQVNRSDDGVYETVEILKDKEEKHAEPVEQVEENNVSDETNIIPE